MSEEKDNPASKTFSEIMKGDKYYNYNIEYSIAGRIA
jgi:hypothetical protein